MAPLARLFWAAALIFSPRLCVLAADEQSKAASEGSHRQTTLRGAGSAAGFTESSRTSLVQTRTKTRRMTTRNPEQLEKWQDSGQAVVADSSAASLLQMIDGIDAKAFGAELHSLCDSEVSRFVGTSGNVHMSQKIKDKFSKLGLKTWVEELVVTDKVQPYLRTNSSLLQKSSVLGGSLNSKARGLGGNVFGYLKGTDLAHEVVVVGAHYDSVNWENQGGHAPGVDDNGSGSALVQLVARAMAKGKRPRRSMMFVGFNAEEEGLVGSEQMASKVGSGDYGDVKAVLIADEVAYPGSGEGSRKAIFETLGSVPGTHTLVDTFAHNALRSGGDGIHGFEVNYHGFGSDHIPFLNKNVPAALLIERNNIAHSDEWGHSERDSYEHVDFDYGASMARLMGRTAAALGSPSTKVVRNVTRHL